MRGLSTVNRPVLGHCDTGPWNIIARDGSPVALIDFEFAGPVDAVWELAQAAWLNAQLHDDVAEQCHLPDTAARSRQLRLILDGYGPPRRQRGDFVDKMIAFAVHDARAEAVRTGLTAETTSATTIPAPGQSPGASAAPPGCSRTVHYSAEP